MTSPRRAPRPTPRQTPAHDAPAFPVRSDGRADLRAVDGGNGNTGGPKRPTREQAIRRRALAAAGGLAVVGLLGFGASRLLPSGDSEPLMHGTSPQIETLQKQENSIVQALMATNGKIETPLRVDGGVLTQRQGLTRVTLHDANATLKLRNQPAVIRDMEINGRLTSNAAVEIGNNGLDQPNKKAGEADTADFYGAYVLTLDDGGVWIGGIVSKDGKDKQYDNPDDFAADLVWFDEGGTIDDVYGGVAIDNLAAKPEMVHPTITVGDTFSTQATVRYFAAPDQP